jgi:uncharacterized HAD superfamily protein/glycosyltransferase involved in cell wall biosynthesis
MLHYKSYYDLSRDIAGGVSKLPRVDLVVGIPKSGLIPAAMIASYLNVQLLDLDSFIFTYSKRSGTRKARATEAPPLKVLIVDDSVNTGTEFARVRRRLEMVTEEIKFTFCAVYGLSTDAHVGVADIVLASLPQPRFFQWNYRNHYIAEHACLDLDGVLCLDPTDDQNDDGDRYTEFVLNAQPLFIPRKDISAIVTSRLERFRPQTEEWLAANGVRYKELIMLDLPSAAERRRLQAHGPFKAEVYRSRDEILFIESNWNQAKYIARYANKPVICTENDAFLFGREHLGSLEKQEQDFSCERLNEIAELRRQVAQLSERVLQAGPDLSRRFADAPQTVKPWRIARAVTSLNAHSRSEAQSLVGLPAAQDKSTDGRRILMISTTFDKAVGAGAAASTTRLRDGLRAQGWEVATLSIEDFPKNNFRNLNQPLGGKEIAFWTSYHDPIHSADLRARVDRINPDVIILGAVDRGILSMFDIARLRYPIIWVGRDNWLHTGGCLFKLGPEAVEAAPASFNGFFEALTCNGYMRSCTKCPGITDHRERSKASLEYQIKRAVLSHRSDIVFAPISDWFAGVLRTAPLTAAHIIKRVYNPIDLECMRPLGQDRGALRRKLGLPENGDLVLIAAHNLANPRKGVKVLYDSLDGSSPPQDLSFVLMGNVNASELPRSIRNRSISLGFIAEEERKAEIYNAVDATLVPALQETLSVVASDSICCGTPVVAFRTSGLTDFVLHKVNGYLARPFDGGELINGVSWLLGQADREAIRDNARRVAVEKFAASTNLAQYGELIELAIRQHSRLGELPAEVETLETAFSLMHHEKASSAQSYIHQDALANGGLHRKRKKKNLFRRLSNSLSKRVRLINSGLLLAVNMDPVALLLQVYCA